MSLLADQITIAVTVYNRRQYIKQAVASAVNQSIPVRVVVLEDCGPDPTLESFVKDEFGPKIEYIRNSRRRGLFGNWNACMDVCATEWLSILHDDDYLAPGFVESMIELADRAPGKALYFGRTIVVDERGKTLGENPIRPVNEDWHSVNLRDIVDGPPFSFPGQLFNVSAAKKVGGFRESSYYCGDWEMWAKLIAIGGATQSAKVSAFNRCHESLDKGTNAVIRNGRQIPATFVQQKRVFALLPEDSKIRFDRVAYQSRHPVPVLFLLRYGASWRPRLLVYHLRLLLLSRPPHWPYAVYQWCARVGGTGFVRLSSKLWNRMRRTKPIPSPLSNGS
jgi:glycosyltransferase involved in cell wall biosynthesis